MAFQKYASVDILEVKSSHAKHRVATLDKFADWSDHNYRTDDEFLYVRVRAISSRVNLNHDSWPSEELAKSYRTFVGKPLFVEHNNSDPKRTRGVIVDAKLHQDDEKTASLDPYYSSDQCWSCHKPPTWIELLLEVDAKTFPKFATAIIKGDIDGFSMGANVERSVCSHCSNEATSPDQFCTHIMQKGAYFDYTDPHSGHKTARKASEHCYDVTFFELSGVVTPADETALAIAGTLKHASDNYPAGVSDSDPHFGGGDEHECPTCDGSGDNPDFTEGEDEPKKCPDCKGSGEVSDEFMKRRDWDSYEGSAKLSGIIPSWFMDAVAAGYVPALLAGGTAWEKYKARFGEQPVEPQEVADRMKEIVIVGGGGDQLSQPGKVYDQDAHTAAKIAERNSPPQYDALTAPEKVDTLRQERDCPVCGSPEMDDGSCRVCGHVEPPEGFDNPDLEKAQQVDQEMRETQGPVEVDDNKSGDPRQMQQMAASTSSTLSGEGASSTGTHVTANSGGSQGRVKVNEKSALPAARRTSDKPKDVQVVEDHNRPVESSVREGTESNMSDTQKTADGASAHGGSDTAPDKRVDVEGVGAVLDSPLDGVEHQDVGKDVNVTGDPTSTWSGTDGQTDPVTSDSFPASEDGVKAASTKEAGPTMPDHEPARVDLDGDIKEEVGDRTKTWSGTEGQADPVTKEVGDLIDAHKAAARKHAFACIRLAETEIDLGLTAQDDKYNRVSELETASQEELDAQLATLARVRTAGLRKQPATRKTAATSVPSLQGRRAAVEPTEHVVPSSDQDLTDAQAFM